MNYFVKKTWIRIAVCAVLVGLVTLVMTGVFGGEGQMTYDPSASDGIAMSWTDAAEKGFGGDVTAHIMLENGAVKELTIDTPDETEGLGKRASEEEFTAQFIGKSGPFTYGEDGIEALSGATVTSNAALKAINRAISGDEPAEEEPEAAAEPATETAETAETAETTETTEAAAGTEIIEQGFGGDVTVHVTLDGDNKIQALTIDTPNETAGLGQRASEAAFTDQFIGKSGPFTYGENGIEALSGATVTSNAALAAINRTFAGETDAPAEEKAEEPAEEKAEEKTEEPAAEEKKEEKSEESASNGQAYGVYRAVKQNDFSTVTVTASVKNGALTAVKITSEGEDGKDLLTDSIREEWAKAILESGSAEPDAITGASLKFSAASVTEAMNEILAEMNGGTADASVEEKAEEPAEEKTEEKAEEPAAEEKKEEKSEESASNGQAYGVYRAVKQNDFSTVTVTASVKNGALTAVKITSEGEDGKDLLTDSIREEWAKAILESGSAEPDAITGASLKFSAASVTEAMKEILAEMNGGTAGAPEEEKTEEKAEEPAEEKTGETAEETAEEKAEEPAAESAAEKAEEPAGTPAAYAGYRAEAVNDFSKITIIAYAKNGVLKSVKIYSEGEVGKDLLTDAIREEWAKAILESGSAAPDAVTGASLKFSSASVQEAMAAILAMIGSN